MQPPLLESHVWSTMASARWPCAFTQRPGTSNQRKAATSAAATYTQIKRNMTNRTIGESLSGESAFFHRPDDQARDWRTASYSRTAAAVEALRLSTPVADCG